MGNDRRHKQTATESDVDHVHPTVRLQVSTAAHIEYVNNRHRSFKYRYSLHVSHGNIAERLSLSDKNKR